MTPVVYTPAQAPGYWCPMGGPPWYRGRKKLAGRCVGDQCPWWRWVENPCRQKPVVGYCGAAGKPSGVP